VARKQSETARPACASGKFRSKRRKNSSIRVKEKGPTRGRPEAEGLGGVARNGWGSRSMDISADTTESIS